MSDDPEPSALMPSLPGMCSWLHRYDKMGTGQTLTPILPMTATCQDMSHRTGVRRLLPAVVDLVSPSPGAAYLYTHSNHRALKLGCLLQAIGTFCSCLLPATSPWSCPQVEQIWGFHCLCCGPQSLLAGGPKTGSTHYDTRTTVSQPASWAMKAGSEVALPTTDGSEEEEGGGTAGKISAMGCTSVALPIL